VTDLMMLPVERHEHARPCRACGGAGVTGDRYTMPVTPPKVLLFEVICPDCGGCGNGDPAHAGCQPDWHAYPGDQDDLLDDLLDDEDLDGLGERCPSCGTGRGWYPIQGFTGEGDDVEMHVLRGLCGCSEPRLVRVPEVRL
jgi:hypothetical protein